MQADETPNPWEYQLTRYGAAPTPWLAHVLHTLAPVLGASVSQGERQAIAETLLADPRCGGLLNTEFDAHKQLTAWQNGLLAWLGQQGDSLAPWPQWPQNALPRLLRELAQVLDLPGIDAQGATSDADPLPIVWHKQLTLQGCRVARWERESGVARPQDWAPRLPDSQSDAWPQAPSVELPIFFVGSRSATAPGINGWLRLWLWPCEGARLAFLPSVPQRAQTLALSWHTGLEQASLWLRHRLQGQGGGWHHHALVWDVYTPDTGYPLLMGNSASTAFALAGLWLARHWAPAPWRGHLASLTREDWRHISITAAISASAEAAAPSDMQPVGGVVAKSLAHWVQSQGSQGLRRPLHVAKNQPLDTAQPGLPPPWVRQHASAYELLKALAQDALALSDPQAALLSAFAPHLQRFAPEASAQAPWHLPLLDPLPSLAEAAQPWSTAVREIVEDGGAHAEHLVPFALSRWAARAQDQHEVGRVHSLFVNLAVNDEDLPPPRAGAARHTGPYTLGQLLAAYEPDPLLPLQNIDALQIVGEPGAGKTWLLARFEQACAERLLWQHERRASKPAPTDAAEPDPYRFDDVPLYVALSELPADLAGDQALADWFRAQVLGAPTASMREGRLRQRLLDPGSDSRLRLRLMLDGLNELKVAPGQTRQERARQVVYALWRELRPGLPMLLGTRTHHHFDFKKNWSNGQQFRAATAALQRWSVPQMVGYLRQRWASGPHQALLAQVDRIEQQLNDPARQRLLDVLGLPLYWRIQCELLEAGARELLDSRARLLAALLWRNLHHEFIEHDEKGPGRSDLTLITEQERTLAADFLKAPDQAPPAFPRKGRLLQGLFALAYQMWLAHPDAPVESRGRVALPLEAEEAPPGAGAAASLSVRGCLRALGWRAASEAQHEQWITDWIEAAKDLGWLMVETRSQTARFAHQAYGEFLASQQLFWKPRHATRHETPKPTDWTAEELGELGRLLAPPALPRTCMAELDAQHRELERLWKQVPASVFKAWQTGGVALPSQAVREALLRGGWSAQGFQQELDFLKGEQVITDQGADWVWSLQAYGDFVRGQGVFARCDEGPWTKQPLAWALLSRHTGLWSPYRDAMRRTVEQRLGVDKTEPLYSETGRLQQAPPGELDEIALLALEHLADPLPWLQALLEQARRCTHGAADSTAPPRQTGCWALLSRALLQERAKLDQRHSQSPALTDWRHALARLLLQVNQSADPELGPGSGGPGEPQGLRAHDLRHRLQAGLCLGQQGPLGSDAGDHLRYECRPVRSHDGREVPGVRLRREHWCDIRPQRGWLGKQNMAPFFMARYPVTVGEFRAFVDAGGYQSAEAAWWLQGLAPERSAARAWLVEQLGQTRSAESGPDYWDDQRWMTQLQPMVGITWYEAAAYAHWAASALYADWLAGLAKDCGVPSLTLRLPTEREWAAALHEVPDRGWPGHRGGGDPSPLWFNHLATGWARTSPVGSFPASRSPGGLMDLAGNQWEWCANAFQGKDHASCIASLENHNELRALRGGSFNSTAALCRVGYRSGVAPDFDLNLNGFRLVLAVVL